MCSLFQFFRAGNRGALIGGGFGAVYGAKKINDELIEISPLERLLVTAVSGGITGSFGAYLGSAWPYSLPFFFLIWANKHWTQYQKR